MASESELLVELCDWENKNKLPMSAKTRKVIKANSNLKKHVGCLSSLPEKSCERGTNSNERVHRMGRTILLKRMSPIGASLLVNKFIAQYNSADDDYPDSYVE